MDHGPSPYLASWSSFYAVTGSAAAALTGLMFVVITLVRSEERSQRSHDGIATFSTPTVLHFGAALLFSAILSAPWHILLHAGELLGAASLLAVAYVVRIALRTMRLTLYTPDREDWIWYTILPLVAYVTVLAGAVLLAILPVDGLFATAAGTLLLLFIGIHNAWDVVTFIAVGGPRGDA